MDPVTLGLCSQIDLDFEVQRAAKDRPHRSRRTAARPSCPPRSRPRRSRRARAFRRRAPPARPEREADIDVDSVFAKLKQLKRPQEDEE